MCDAVVKSLAIGFFDGVHLGHQAVLRGASVVLTFRNHPLSVLAPDKAPWLIMTPDEREREIKACGVGRVVMLDFTREIASLSPEDFLARFIRPVGQGCAQIICGANWRFGKGGVGDACFLRDEGIDVSVMPYAQYEGERISSSRIRRCLERGEIERANDMMNRRFALRGKRFQGKGKGTEIGFSTVNYRLEDRELRLPFGAYEVEMGGVRGVANYGLAPTMGEGAWEKPVAEVHFRTAVDDDVLRTASIEFVRFLRAERRFGSVEELKRQIGEDCRRVWK